MTAKLIKLPRARTRSESDPDLAEKAAGGDRAAYSELVRRHQGTVRGLMRRLTGGHQADADDLSQAAFLRAWTQIGTYSGGQFRSWLCTIAYREFLQAKRKVKAQMRISDAVNALGVDISYTDTKAASVDMDNALRSLSDEQRIAIVLCVSAGMSHSEASIATGWPLGTVKSHVLRGKAALQASLVDYGVA